VLARSRFFFGSISISDQISKIGMSLSKKVYLLLIGAFLVSFCAQAHPYHTSIGEMHYNPKSQSLEISLKVFTDDLEKSLSETVKKPVILSQKAEIKNQIAILLKNSFAIEQAGKALPQQFIGLEAEKDTYWLYLEVKVKPELLSELKIRNQLLMETFPDQMNILNLEIKGQKKTLLFRAEDYRKSLL
jgi:hypothetical protein